MAFAPVATKSSKLSLFAAPAPNYKDFSGPPDGDYVRYVEGLMVWSQQEHERQRLKSLGEKARAQTQSDHQWGRSPAATAPARSASAVLASTAQPGSVEGRLERLRRKAAAQASKLSTQIPQPEGNRTKPQAKASVFGVLAMFAGFVLAGMFAPALLPVVIIGWVVFNVVRAVRAASSSSSKS